MCRPMTLMVRLDRRAPLRQGEVLGKRSMTFSPVIVAGFAVLADVGAVVLPGLFFHR